MPDYNFSTLSPADFESLSRDLLQREFGVQLETFCCGRDGGIDLRYCRPAKGDLWIIQSKHYLRSGVSQLKTVLKDQEMQKVRKLKPTRYVLTTSVSLTPQRKDQLHSILQPYCQHPGDIIGQEDLNCLLSKHPEVEKQYFKLWLPSTAVLERLLHNGVFTQSALELDEIKLHLSLFVPTDALDRSLAMLNESGVCMLTGIPGIGKTTTARLLVAQHVYEGWEGIYLTGQVRDAFKVHDPSKRQIVFYDDFLGVIGLRERADRSEDQALYLLITACRRNPGKTRLILTTRENVFAQACQLSEVLQKRTGIEAAKSTVELKDYTDTIRAQILVNHLYFYGIDPDVCSEFVRSGAARKTLAHANYNPRIVETMCTMKGVGELKCRQFSMRFLKMLDSPAEIWEYAYHNQLTEHAQALLLVFAMHGPSVTTDSVKHHFRIFAKEAGFRQIGFERMFAGSLKELDGTFVTVEAGTKHSYLRYHTPAIHDFAAAELKRDSHVLKVALRTFTYEGVLLTAANLLVTNHPKDVTANDVVAAMERADGKTAYRVYDFGSIRSLKDPDPPEHALTIWLDIVQRFKNRNAAVQVMRRIECFLESLVDRRLHIDLVVRLYFAYEGAAHKWRRRQNVMRDEIRSRILPYCREPDDFAAVARLIPEEKLDEVALEVIRERFRVEYWDWLDSQVDSASSSDEINEAIASVTHTAEALGVSENELDLDDAEKKAQQLAAREDDAADERREEWSFRQNDKRMQARRVDDILDSLRR